MAQAQVQNPQSIRFGNGVLYIDGVNVGLLESAVATINWTVVELKAHNGQLPPRKRPEEVIFGASLYEFDLEKFANLIDDHGVLSSVAGTPVGPLWQTILSGEWNHSVFIPFPFQNGDGSQPTIANVAGATDGALTDNDDYEILKVNGVRGLMLDDPANATNLTTETQDITYDITYTPSASKKIVWSDVLALLQYHELVFENTDENGKKFNIKIPKGYNRANYSLEFASDYAEDEVLKIPIEFKAYPTDTNQLFEIYDEQAV